MPPGVPSLVPSRLRRSVSCPTQGDDENWMKHTLSWLDKPHVEDAKVVLKYRRVIDQPLDKETRLVTRPAPGPEPGPVQVRWLRPSSQVTPPRCGTQRGPFHQPVMVESVARRIQGNFVRCDVWSKRVFDSPWIWALTLRPLLTSFSLAPLRV